MRVLILIIIATLSSILFAQDCCYKIPLITVTSTSIQQIKPDKATLIVDVDKKYSLEEIYRVSDSFLFSRQDRDIQLIDGDNITHSLTQLNVKNDSAYFVKSFIIEVYNLDEIQKTYNALLSKGFSKFRDIDFGLQNVEPVKEQAREKAIQKAIEKAKQYARLSRQTLGSVFAITEKEYMLSNWYNHKEREYYPDFRDAIQITNPGYITVTISLEVSFNIKTE